MSDPRFIRTGDVRFALAHAAEEAGEVVAAIGKSLRWGLDSVNPLLPVDQQETNEAWLRREIADLRGALDGLEAEMGTRPSAAPIGAEPGFVMVPVVPSEADIEALCQARCTLPGIRWDDGMTEGVARIERMLAERQWSAMLAAASSEGRE